MAETAGNKPYSNFILANTVEDQFLSHIDHARFCTVDTSLTGVPGMIKKFHKYYAKVTTPASGNDPAVITKGGQAAEILQLKAGNTKFIEADYGEESYEIKLAQNTGIFYDEEQMTDPYIGLTIARYSGTDLFNKMNADVIGEFENTSQTVTVTNAAFFDAFVDAQALIPESDESTDAGNGTFALVNKADYAAVRKSLKDSLQYRSEFAKQGYIGHVAGTPLFVSNLATSKKIILATRKAVTLFVKSGTQVEDYQLYNRSSADADIRKNTIISRKYYVAALTDERYATLLTWS